MSEETKTSAPERHLERTNHRTLSPDYAGDILVWDIDKTYLDTRFSSLRGLLAIPFEFAIDKRAQPGAVALLRALRRGPDRESAIVPLYFVSGSPPVLRRVIERKMTLDGVDFDGITFKDQLGLLLEGRPSAIREQVGYKLTALLLYRRELPDAARYLFFGDDVERDADVFLLFGDVMAGLRGDALFQRMRDLGAQVPETRAAVDLAEGLPKTENPVERVFIHLEKNPEQHGFGDARVTATRSFLQTALVTAEMGRIAKAGITAVANDLRQRHVPEAAIERDLADARDRLHVSDAALALARR